MPLATFLNGGTITTLRGLSWLALSDSGRVGAGTMVGDTGGGATTTWTYGGTIPCRVDPLSGRELLTAGRISDRSTHLITVPPGTGVTTSNRFAVTGRGTFEITAVQDRTGELVRSLEAVKVS
jgi:head-tail adaptor